MSEIKAKKQDREQLPSLATVPNGGHHKWSLVGKSSYIQDVRSIPTPF